MLRRKIKFCLGKPIKNLKNRRKSWKNKSNKILIAKEILLGHKPPWPKEEPFPEMNSDPGKNLLSWTAKVLARSSWKICSKTDQE